MSYWKCIIKLNELSAYDAIAGSSHMSQSDSLQVFNATIYFFYRGMNNFFSNCRIIYFLKLMASSWGNHWPKCHVSLCIFERKFRRYMQESFRLPSWSLAMTGCIFLCVCVCVGGTVHLSIGTYCPEASDPPGAGVQVMHHQLWVLGTEHGSFARTVSALNWWAISLAQHQKSYFRWFRFRPPNSPLSKFLIISANTIKS